MAKHYKRFSELQSKMSPEQRAQNKTEIERMIRELPLDELRAARNLTQEHLAKVMGVKQSAISRMERRTDVYVSTLSSFVEAMGGHLEIRAVFPEGAVLISQFGEEPRSPWRLAVEHQTCRDPLRLSCLPSRNHASVRVQDFEVLFYILHETQRVTRRADLQRRITYAISLDAPAPR